MESSTTRGEARAEAEPKTKNAVPRRLLSVLASATLALSGCGESETERIDNRLEKAEANTKAKNQEKYLSLIKGHASASAIVQHAIFNKNLSSYIGDPHWIERRYRGYCLELENTPYYRTYTDDSYGVVRSKKRHALKETITGNDFPRVLTRAETSPRFSEVSDSRNDNGSYDVIVDPNDDSIVPLRFEVMKKDNELPTVEPSDATTQRVINLGDCHSPLLK